MFPSTMTITCTQNKATSLFSDLHLHRRKHEYMQVWNFRVQRLCKVFVFPKYPPVREYSTHSRFFLIQHYRNILRLSNYETCFYLYINTVSTRSQEASCSLLTAFQTVDIKAHTRGVPPPAATVDAHWSFSHTCQIVSGRDTQIAPDASISV